MDTEVITTDGFILSRHWDDVAVASGLGKLRQLQLCIWLITPEGPLKVLLEGQAAVFFLAEDELDAATALLRREFGASASHPAVAPVWEARRLQLKTFQQNPVAGLYFREQRTLYRARELLQRHRLTPLEADIQPPDRFLMERFITGAMRVKGAVTAEAGVRITRNPVLRPGDYQPGFRVLSLDIETSMNGEQLYCIGALATDSAGAQSLLQRKVFMLGSGDVPENQDYLVFCADEKALLQSFLAWFEMADADMIIGWNVINFDLRFLQRKADEHALRLGLGRQRSLPEWRQSREDNQHYSVILPGRLVLDGIDTLKSATYRFESFTLDFVARELLQRGKLSDDADHRGEAISEQFLHDKAALAAYNLEDCQLVWDIFVEARLLDFAVQRARLTGLAMDRFGGSVAAFDNRYLPRLHRQGFVAPALPADPVGVGSPGGYVMDSKPGFYRDVLVLDFKSLYPSIIRTFYIDPLARVAGSEYEREHCGRQRQEIRDREETADVDLDVLVPGFNGAVFHKHSAILPNLIGELWQARDEAKRQRNGAMSQAIKIIMNSFYGVLGTPGCRFFDYRLPSSITLRGHQILTRSRELIEELGHRVIYGDTDSVFVCLQGAAGKPLAQISREGRALAEHLNSCWSNYLEQHYQLQSYLEIEFETHYSRFLMPTIRGTETGSKKRYAGLIERADAEPQLVFKGLEAVRTDWTPLAREFQRELYRRIFMQQPYEDYILATLRDIRAEKLDHKLYYRKRIRRQLRDYTRNVPPHVQAARKADDSRRARGDKPRYERGGWIRYALTINGAEALENRTSRLDYELLIERQISPVVDGIVQFLGTSFRQIADRQIGLF